MAKMGGFSVTEMKKLQKQLNKIQQGNVEAFVDACAKELAARLLSKVIKRTPVGEYGNMVEFDANIPAKHVEFNTKDGKHISFDTKAKTKHVKFTPKTGKKGGTLRRGWTAKTHEEAESGSWKSDSAASTKATAWAKELQINHVGNTLVIEIVNPVEYASYVEYGHRTANHKGWVQGRFMLTISEQEIQNIAPKVLESKIKKFLGECLQ